MTHEDRPERDSTQRFVDYLRALHEREDRGALASLRRSLIDPTGMSASACPYVVPFVGREPHLRREHAFFLIGALFALHPEHREGVSLGAALRRLSIASSSDGKESPSVRARFVALLDAHPDDVGDHLRHAVGLCRAHELGLDWEELLRDVLRLQHPDRVVQRRWARHFWAEHEEQRAPDSPTIVAMPEATS